MNRILGVAGSPRKKGNTHILVSGILDGAKAEGAETEMLFLNELVIRECDGCHSCWKGRQCSKRDDMNVIYPKIVESDVIVFGTPVYWYGPTALMKCFMDRFVYFNCPENRSKIKGKAAVLAIPFEEDNIKTADLLVRFFVKSLRYLEMKIVGKILCPGVSARGDILKREEFLEKGYRLGQRIAKLRRY
ncbi:MAG: flavodoxin family protein [Nitrospirota bacterium]